MPKIDIQLNLFLFALGNGNVFRVSVYARGTAMIFLEYTVVVGNRGEAYRLGDFQY